MVETPTNEKINMDLQLDNKIQYKLNEISRINDYFFAEICKREGTSKTLSKCITKLDYFDKALLLV